MNTSSRIHVKLLVEGCEIEGAVDLPGPSDTNPPRRVLLPVLRQITDAIVNIAENRVHEQGASISCKKGCDACCRQMVPISPTEAYALNELLKTLEAEHANRIRARFQKHLDALNRAGLLNSLHDRAHLSPERLSQLDRDYFALQLPCPFLERRACSIHKNRPLACREFLVTSDPIHCADPGSGQVTQVQLGAKISAALLAIEPWLPLVLTLDFTAKIPESAPTLAPAEDLTSLLNSLQSDPPSPSESYNS